MQNYKKESHLADTHHIFLPLSLPKVLVPTAKIYNFASNYHIFRIFFSQRSCSDPLIALYIVSYLVTFSFFFVSI
jgi:hypothetical protein